MIFYYLYDGSRPPGSTPLAACQKGGMHCQKETIIGAERQSDSFLGTLFQMQLCLFTSISSFVSLHHVSVQVNGQETKKLDAFFLLGFLLTHEQKKVRPDNQTVYY